MRKYLVGVLSGVLLGAASVIYADVSAPHFAANDAETIAKCFETAKAGNTVVSFKLTEEEIDYTSAVCWPEGIK